MRGGKVTKLKTYRRARDRRIIAGIDIGSAKTACFIAELIVDPDGAVDAEIIGVGCHGARTRLNGGLSVDEVEASLRRAVDAAERMAGVRIDSVHIAVPGRLIRARRIGVDLEIADGVVTEEDVDDSLAEGASLGSAPECVALSASPIAYRIDSELVVDDPVGHSGSVLSTELLGLSARESAIDNLISIAERCGLQVAAVTPAPVAAAETVLLEDEKELGVILIDIGAMTTDFAVYDDGALINCGGVALGGGNITKDIAQIFGAPLGDAERMKILHGAALIGAGDEHRFIDFPQLGDGAETTRVSRADLCEVIIPRMEEIFELVNARLSDETRRRSNLRRAVITGGGGQLLGAREVAERALGMRARIGRPSPALGAPEAGAAPGFSVCAGLLQKVVNEVSENKFSLGARNQSPHLLMKSSLLGGASAWFRAKF